MWRCVDVEMCRFGDVEMCRYGVVEMFGDVDMEIWSYIRCKVMPLGS